MAGANSLPQLLRKNQAAVLADWTQRQLQSLSSRRDLISEGDLRRESQQFLEAFTEAVESGDPERPSGPAWDRLHEMLGDLSVSRARIGFSPTETATFVFSLKQPLFELIRGSFTTADDV